MNTELRTLFKFQQIICEMQQVILNMRKSQSDQIKIDKAVERVDSLLEVYNTFDKFYYSAHFQAQKNLELQNENIELCQQIETLTTERNKLLQSLGWGQQEQTPPTATAATMQIAYSRR